MSEFLAEKFEKLSPYVPGEQPRDKSYVKLNTNENPFPPSPGVSEAVRAEAGRLNLYSDPECTELSARLAGGFGLSADNIMLTNGSDEALSFIFFAFGGGFIFPEHTYGFYKVFAELYGAEYEEAPLNGDFTISPEKYIKSSKNIVIANPNAPTGIYLGLSEIEELLNSKDNRLVIVDEAYIDFGGESAAGLLRNHNNLIVVRTFSKSRGLAGLRLGYVLASSEIISDLNRIRYSVNPYNVDRLALAAGIASLEDEAYFRDKLNIVKANREYTSERLRELGFSVIPSSANFVFAKKDGVSGESLYLALKQKGVLVRHFGKKGIEDYIRVTIGTKKEMDIFLTKLKEALL